MKILKNWRSTREYREWRVQIIRRDKCCVICGSRKQRQVHHMNDATYHPDERLDLENGVTLCYECHMNFHNNFKRSSRQKCTKYDFNNFKCLSSYFKEKFTK